MTNVILPPGLNIGFLGFHVDQRKVTLYDGGNSRFSASTLPTIGASVANVLSLPNETENKYLLIQSVVTTQREMLALYERYTGTKWEVEHMDTADLEKETNEKLARGDYSTIYNLVYRACFGEGYGGEFLEDNNDLLRLPKLDAKEFEALVKGTL